MRKDKNNLPKLEKKGDSLKYNYEVRNGILESRYRQIYAVNHPLDPL